MHIIIPCSLWFDVEKKYKTMQHGFTEGSGTLWFDVEKKYKTIDLSKVNVKSLLWFDVEKKYQTIVKICVGKSISCGLMQ